MFICESKSLWNILLDSCVEFSKYFIGFKKIVLRTFADISLELVEFYGLLYNILLCSVKFYKIVYSVQIYK